MPSGRERWERVLLAEHNLSLAVRNLPLDGRLNVGQFNAFVPGQQQLASGSALCGFCACSKGIPAQ